MGDRVVIRASDHREAMGCVVASYGLPKSVLEIVPSVYDWCKENGIEETNTGRMAKCFFNWNNDECHIVMRDCFSQADFDTVKTCMEYYGLEEDARRLVTPALSLLHLLLHEIAGPVIKTTEQIPRDRWAFKELHKHAI